MTEPLTIDSFAPHLGETFRMIVNGEWEIHMTLAEAAQLPGDPRSAQQPFSLIFRAPLQAIVSQQILRVEHDTMAPTEIFLVPIAPDAEGMRYQAVFN